MNKLILQNLLSRIPTTIVNSLIFMRVKISHDRKVLEKVIFPFFLRNPEYEHILFVGVANYTRSYNFYFRSKDYWSIDYNPEMKKYGAKSHIVGSITDIDKFFSRGCFDAIFLNGVIGWGLNEKKDIEVAIRSIHYCLRSNGILIIGWNDRPPFNAIPPAKINGLARFKPYFFPPLKASQFKTGSKKYRGIFNFYIKYR